MNKILIILFLAIALTACQEDPGGKSHSNDPDSIKTVQRRISTQEMAKVNPAKLLKLKNKLAENYQISKGDKEIVALDKSLHSKVEKIAFVHKDNGLRFHLNLYEYGAKREYKNAYETFLKSIGDMQKVKEGIDMPSIKSPPMSVIVNRGNIVVLRYSCNDKDKNDWNSIHNNIISQFADKDSKIIRIACGGPLNWETID